MEKYPAPWDIQVQDLSNCRLMTNGAGALLVPDDSLLRFFKTQNNFLSNKMRHLLSGLGAAI